MIDTREKLLAAHRLICESARRVMVGKNSDYALEDYPYKNLESTAAFTRVSTEEGILVRMGDKMSRLGVLLDPSNSGPAVKDESIDDTLLDLINYAILLMGVRSCRSKTESTS